MNTKLLKNQKSTSPLNSNPVTPVMERNPLDWYDLTESTNSILNGLIAYASRERRKELDKLNPSQEKIAKLTAFQDEVLAVNNNTQNFKNLERMEELIAHYGPILKAANQRTR
jgi:hypothetical protein